jgi:peptide deformylase
MVRDVLFYPERAAEVREVSEPERGFGLRAHRLITDLVDTLLAHPEGVGLAAPQLGFHRRVVVVRLGAEDKSAAEAEPPMALVNPVVLEAGNERKDFDGCLSFPGLVGRTVRPHRLRVSWLDGYATAHHRVFEGFDAVVVHHEIDHLDGVLFIDRVEEAKDLYRIQIDEEGRRVEVPVSVGA